MGRKAGGKGTEAGSLRLGFALGIAFSAGIALLVLAGIRGQYALGLAGFGFTYSEGERAGRIIEVRHEGVFWRTWEATMAVTQSGASAGLWDFSVDAADPGAAAKVKALQDAMRRGKLVRVDYAQHWGARPSRCATEYTCRSVKPHGGR